MHQRSKMIKQYSRMFPALALSLIGGVFAPVVKADEWNKRTKIAVDRPIEIQNTILPAGTYVIKLLDSPEERYTVQVFNSAENHLITTILAVPIYRDRAADNSEFNFYKVEDGQPAALHSWFYPGDSIGFEFISDRERAILQAHRRHTNATSVNSGGE
jgi:hypothetical protein